MPIKGHISVTVRIQNKMRIDPYVDFVDINEFKFHQGVLKILNGSELMA